MSKLEAITSALAQVRARGTFVSRDTTTNEHLVLSVKGVGPIQLPVSNAQARALCDVARPASFGKRSETLRDPDVRSTWEIPRSRVRIDKRAWNKSLIPQLEGIRHTLGLPSRARLEAVFDKLLVYETGQHFATHQDSERHDDMLASLSVVLPSQYSGGGLEVEHRGERKIFQRTRSAGDPLTFIAFYPDCHHRVRPVRSGYRVVLAYHLLLHDAEELTAGPEDWQAVETLQQLVGTFFSKAPASNTAQRSPPEKLVYLLDHEYTQSSLAWHRLKNGDAVRAGVLRSVAEYLDCEICLSLADVQEIWACDGEGSAWDDAGGYNDYGYDDEDEEEEEYEKQPSAGPDASQLTELMDEDLDLRHAIDASGVKMRWVPTSPDGDELCWTTASVQLEPFQTEYEGWMGNYGNTVERWYHRAAVLLWPRDRAFSVRSQADPRYALDALAALLRSGDSSAVREARRLAATLPAAWSRAASAAATPTMMNKAMQVASAIGATATATALLRPFDRAHLTRASIAPLLKLIDAYGSDWSCEAMELWRGRPGERDAKWFRFLPGLCEALADARQAETTRFGRRLLGADWSVVKQQCLVALADYGRPDARTRLRQLCEQALQLATGAVHLDDRTLHAGIVELLASDEHPMPVEALVEALQACGKLANSDKTMSQLAPVWVHARDAISERLAQSVRRDDDWSIDVPFDCACELCSTLKGFLRAPDRKRFDWPIAKHKRQHVHQQLRSYELPVTHVTRRQGSPHTLVLTKRPVLAERARREREDLVAALAWLDSERESFGQAVSRRR